MSNDLIDLSNKRNLSDERFKGTYTQTLLDKDTGDLWIKIPEYYLEQIHATHEDRFFIYWMEGKEQKGLLVIDRDKELPIDPINDYTEEELSS